MKIRKIDIPYYVFLLIFFACTDIYLVNGVKIVYIFALIAAFTFFIHGIRLNKKIFFYGCGI